MILNAERFVLHRYQMSAGQTLGFYLCEKVAMLKYFYSLRQVKTTFNCCCKQPIQSLKSLTSCIIHNKAGTFNVQLYGQICILSLKAYKTTAWPLHRSCMSSHCNSTTPSDTVQCVNVYTKCRHAIYSSIEHIQHGANKVCTSHQTESLV